MKLKPLLTGTGFLILFLISACKESDEPTPQITSKWEVFTTKNGLSSDTILSLAQDKNGTIWIGAQNGVCKLDNTTSTDFKKVRNGYKVNSISCSDDYVMFASSKGGLVIINNIWYYTNSVRKNCIDMEFFNNSFLCLYEDENLYVNNDSIGVIRDLKDIYVNGESLWYCRFGGLYRIFPSKITYSESNGMSSNVCFTMYQDSKNVIWAGMFNEEGISKISNNEIKNLKCGYIGSIAEDKKGNMWFGSQYYGIYKLETTGNLINYTKLDGLPNNKVTDILVTTDGLIWVSTLGGGIAKFKN